MSGIVSGITKVFTSVGSAVARVGQSVAAVGATVFTTGAATGAKSLASGGLNAAASGGGILSKVLTGAIKQGAVGALLGGGISALTGNGFGKGALIGGLGGAAMGGISGLSAGNGLLPAGATMPAGEAGLTSAGTATGVAPTGVTQSAPSSARFGENIPAAQGRGGLAAALGDQSGTMTGGGTMAAGKTGRVISGGGAAEGSALVAGAAAAPAAAAAAGGGGGLLSFLGTETGGNIISGLGQGAMSYFQSQKDDEKLKMQAEEYDKTRAADLEKEMRIRNSYAMSPAAYESAPAPDTTVRPTPAQAYGRGTRYEYSSEAGRIVQVPA